ncbi:MAG TPA: type II toxin-antitoxin system VapC family toxin [Dehalococcoidia bacterium]|jgi:predicted nucleic acid-binding protein
MTQVQAGAQDGLAISVITYGEVYEGILYSRNRVQNLQRWEDFLAGFDIINVTAPIAEIWADMRGLLRGRGLTTGDNDLLIGATALYFDMAVMTFNVKDFKRIDHLRIVVPDQEPVVPTP